MQTSADATAAFDVAVIGSALAGLVSALALAESGANVALIGPRSDGETVRRDTRSTALFGPSLILLERLGVGNGLIGSAQKLVGLRLIDDTDALIRAPEVLFEAREIGFDAFGLNFENADLLRVLAEAVARHPRITWESVFANSFAVGDDRVILALADGRKLDARLVVGADGAASMTRQAAGIETHAWSYPQVAIASRFGHARPHGGISTELHRRAGPLTTVPLPGRNSSLVWVETATEAARLMALDDAGFASALEKRLGAVLGSIGEIGARAAFPIAGVAADVIAHNRAALVGEAAHRLPPIGAQGLNLGLRDIAWLAELVEGALLGGDDPGSAALLAEYSRRRKADIASRTMVVDTLNRSLFSGLLPLDLARGGGIAALKMVPPLRRLFMREGMAPAGPLPRLMEARA